METKELMVLKAELLPLDVNGKPKYTNLQEFNSLVMSPPRNTWVKTNKFSQNAKYLPIRIVEELLTGIFPFWQVEQVGTTQILGNSIIISVNLKVYHPLLNQWLNFAGIGAVPIEVEKGAHPTDWTKLNSKAMHKNVPAAMSFAISNAAKKIGKIFGSHLNSTETIG